MKRQQMPGRLLQVILKFGVFAAGRLWTRMATSLMHRKLLSDFPA